MVSDISKLKKQNSILNRALNEEKKITRRLLGSKLAAEQKLDALQKVIITFFLSISISY